jgi:hypothetical protein
MILEASVILMVIFNVPHTIVFKILILKNRLVYYVIVKLTLNLKSEFVLPVL